TIAGSAAQAASLPTVNATVSSTSIAIAGAVQSGAVNVVSTATGGKEPNVVFVALKPSVTLTEFYAALDANKLSDPNTASKYGSIGFGPEAPKSKKTEVQQVFSPGAA